MIIIKSHHFVYTFINYMQQPMLLHCCHNRKGGAWKRCARYLAEQIKLVGGPDATRRPWFDHP